jgi:NADH:ubiquinone oxidoreductase subunit K
MYSIFIYIFLSHFLFIVSLQIFINAKENILIMFIAAEILNLSGILNFIIMFYFYQNGGGQSLAMLMFSVGAAEAAIALTLIINFVKLQNTLSIAN